MKENILIQDLYPTRKKSAPEIIKRLEPVVYSNKNKSKKKRLSKNQLDFFENNGFLFFPKLFDSSEIELLLSELEKLRKNKKLYSSDQFVLEPESRNVRSIFKIHRTNNIFQNLSQDSRIIDVVEQLLDSSVYITQSRINIKPGFEGKEFYWHSDFETWHSEDGMPQMRAISCAINLTENYEFNGPLMVIPGSHKFFISCVGKTPNNNYLYSLKKQEIGTPDKKILDKFAHDMGIVSVQGPPGSVVFFDCNILHASAGNITPFPRSNVFIVYNSVENELEEPFCGKKPRPEYIATRKMEKIISQDSSLAKKFKKIKKTET